MNIEDKKQILLFSRGGTCQEERLPPPLLANGKLIDNKDLDEYLVFVYLYSDLLQFYEEDAPVSHNAWRHFLEFDDTVIYSLILHTQINKLTEPISNNFLALRHFKHLQSNNKYFKNLLSTLEELLVLLGYWYENLSEGSTIRLEIYNLLRYELNQNIRLLYNTLQLMRQGDPNESNQTSTSFLAFIESLWERYQILEPTNNSIDENVDHVTMHQQIQNTLHDLFESIFNGMANLQKLAREGYQATLVNQQHRPQAALLIAFLRLLEYAKSHMNYIPQRHLDYYYRDVLKFKEKPTQPDSVFVNFRLKGNQSYLFLPQGTQLLAGQDATGANIVFETDKAITINQGIISKIQTFERSQQGYNTKDNLPVVNVAMATYNMDELYSKKAKLYLFSKKYAELAASQQTSTGQPLGLLINSSILYLQEGQREIALTFQLKEEALEALKQRAQQLITTTTETVYETLAALFNKAIAVQFTAATDWVTLPASAVTFYFDQQDRCFKMVLTLLPGTPGVVNFDSAIHGPITEVKTPAIRLIAKDEAHIAHIYLFRELEIEKLNIQVKVSDYRGLILQNDLGLIESNQTFQPFGPFPKLHANLYMGSDEVFTKNLQDFKINIEWEDLPTIEGGFKAHYQAYPHQITAKDFKVNVAYLKQRQWQPFYPEHRQQLSLFDYEQVSPHSPEKLKSKRVIDNLDKDLLGFTQEKYTLHPPLWTSKTLTGFLKLELCGPDIAFGHALYPKLVAQSLMHKKGHHTSKNAPPTIYEPYTPTIKSLSIDYVAQESFDFTKQSLGKPDHNDYGYVKLFPFGYRKEFPNANLQRITFLPDTDDGEHFLALGITNLNGSTLRLHIEIDEASIDPNKEFTKPTWRCLSNNMWINFTEKEIVSDTTEGLTKSGIIELNVPPTINQTNTLMAAGFSWIKAMFPANVSSLPTILGIYTQAVSATRKIVPYQTQQQPIRLTPYSIENIIGKTAQAVTVTQPFSSFGGKAGETSTQLYTRISERLRHKSRAISPWDYERIVLDKFPEVFRVKCINHSQKKHPFTPQPGKLILVVIPTIKGKKIGENAFPQASKQLLESIRQELQKVASPFVSIEVINPVYEEVKVNLEVKFKKGYENGLYANELQKAIKVFLSPWLFNPSEDIRLGVIIPSSKIIDFISKRRYIEAIGNFSILKYTGSNITKITDYDNQLMSTYPWSVMFSSDKHRITVVDNIDPNTNFRYGGVDDMSLEYDFIVGPWETVPNKSWLNEVEKETIQESLEEYYLITKKSIKY
jgi:hypothetical protein